MSQPCRFSRRRFLGVSGSATLLSMVPLSFPQALSRASQWPPTSDPLLLLEWRYIAGRFTTGGRDDGFIVAISQRPSPFQIQELLVMRQGFGPNPTAAHASYAGSITYDTASATYRFLDQQSQELLRWQFDATTQTYQVQVTTPELTLPTVQFNPQLPLITEGGGRINIGGFTIDSFIGPVSAQVNTDYVADWNVITLNGQSAGYARVDMQVLYAAPGSGSIANDYDHHWFAVAADLDKPGGGSEPVWLTAWRIEGAPLRWTITIARGLGATATVQSLTEAQSVVQPLTITATDLQLLPPPSTLVTGRAWRLQAGQLQPGDLLDLQLEVPAGQFITGGRAAEVLPTDQKMEEAVGTVATGRILGRTLRNVKLVAAETTFEFRQVFLPFAKR